MCAYLGQQLLTARKQGDTTKHPTLSAKGTPSGAVADRLDWPACTQAHLCHEKWITHNHCAIRDTRKENCTLCKASLQPSHTLSNSDCIIFGNAVYEEHLLPALTLSTQTKGYVTAPTLTHALTHTPYCLPIYLHTYVLVFKHTYTWHIPNTCKLNTFTILRQSR